MVSLDTLLRWMPWGRKDVELELNPEELVSVLLADAALVLEKPQLPQWRGETTGYPRDDPRVLAYQRLSEAGIVPALRWNEGMLATSHEPEKYLLAVTDVAENVLACVQPPLQPWTVHISGKARFHYSTLLAEFEDNRERIANAAKGYIQRYLTMEIGHVRGLLSILRQSDVPTRKQIAQADTGVESADKIITQLFQRYPVITAFLETMEEDSFSQQCRELEDQLVAYRSQRKELLAAVTRTEQEREINKAIDRVCASVPTSYLTSQAPLLERLQNFRRAWRDIQDQYTLAESRTCVVQGREDIDRTMNSRKAALYPIVERALQNESLCAEARATSWKIDYDKRAGDVNKYHNQAQAILAESKNIWKAVPFGKEIDKTFTSLYNLLNTEKEIGDVYALAEYGFNASVGSSTEKRELLDRYKAQSLDLVATIEERYAHAPFRNRVETTFGVLYDSLHLAEEDDDSDVTCVTGEIDLEETGLTADRQVMAFVDSNPNIRIDDPAWLERYAREAGRLHARDEASGVWDLKVLFALQEETSSTTTFETQN